MKKYQVHFHIHSGYDPIVLADSEEEALKKAQEAFENAPEEDLDYIDSECEGVVRVWDADNAALGDFAPFELKKFPEVCGSLTIDEMKDFDIEHAEDPQTREAFMQAAGMKALDPYGWASFELDNEKFEKVLASCEESTGFTDYIAGQFGSDPDTEPEKLLRMYGNASFDVRKIIDAFCVYACGWSFATLISQYADSLDAEGDTDFCGTIELKDRCDFTDPSYDRNVWCRTTVENMLPGTYNCYAEVDDNGRVASSWIIHEDFDIEDDQGAYTMVDSTEVLPGCGVDEGLFGYFADKPDLKSWSNGKINFLDKTGFYTEAGFGAGDYCPVLWKNADGKVVGAGTRFM